MLVHTTTTTIAAREFSQHSGVLDLASGTRFDDGIRPPTTSSTLTGTGHESESVFTSMGAQPYLIRPRMGNCIWLRVRGMVAVGIARRSDGERKDMKD